MNKIYTFILAIVVSATLWAQAPQKFSYQAVVRNANNELVTNKQVGMKISLLQTSETGTAVYEETQTPTSNANGLVSIAIGGGTKVSGDFDKINWANGPYFVKTEIDPAGGTSYSLITTSQLLSVPYALFAANSQPGPKGDTGAQGPKGDQGIQGETGNGLINGTSNGEIMYWAGSSWVTLSAGSQGQFLSFCDGKPTWTVEGKCPGIITELNCGTAIHNGNLAATIACNANSVISYSGGNGEYYNGQTVSSTGVTGLTATLIEGKFVKGNGTLTFTISGIPASIGTAYFAINVGGKTCNFSRIINSPPSLGSNISDVDGNSYKTVNIGNQTWMAENLKVSKYNDGTDIPNIEINTDWEKNTTGAWCYYNNDEANNAKYGKLYNWYALSTTTNGDKNVCPTGWHVPNDAEWTVLTDYLGGLSLAGGQMREVGITSWDSPNTGATNTSLFTGIPGGVRTFGGIFSSIGNRSWWWSSTLYSMSNSINAGYLILENNQAYTYILKIDPQLGFSVRCIKD
jgi:uncharacterized protein (TIGR02145 family)